jgi:glycosyltransferase involved in cell wall biosynthesis
MRFSVIIPVYNVEEYLEQCLRSIISQKFTDYEIILINDGSTDNSAKICEFFTQEFIQIRYFSKQNGGLSSARNEGLRESVGEYIIFTDSDDFWIGENVLSDLDEIIKNENPDLILHEETRYFSEEISIYENNICKIKYNSNDFRTHILDLIYNEVYVASAWDKVIKREILIKNNLFFPLNRKSEDIEWCAKLINHIESHSFYNHSFYNYRQSNVNSITKNINNKHLIDIFQMIQGCLNERENSCLSNQKAIENFLTINYVVLLMNYYKIDKLDRVKIKKELVEWRFLFRKNSNYRVDKLHKFVGKSSFNTLVIILDRYRFFNDYLKNNMLFGKLIRINK